MSIADILVYIDPEESNSEALAAAMSLADRHSAHLTALYVIAPAYIPSYAGIESSLSAAALREIEDRNQNRAIEAKRKFDEVVMPWEGKISWMEISGEPESVAVDMARNFDLVVMPTPGEDSMHSRLDHVFERVSIASGRPILRIPANYSGGEIGRRVMVAWKNSRESTRAVHDAMPFLTSADNVTIATVNPPKDVDVPCAELAEHLSRHGVQVEVESAFAYRHDVGKQILTLATTFESDLLVMGLYGQPRVAEIVLGGASRHIVQNTTIPVLFSH